MEIKSKEDPLAFRYRPNAQLREATKEEQKYITSKMPLLLKEWRDDIEHVVRVGDDAHMDRLEYFHKKCQDVAVERLSFKRCLDIINSYKAFFTGDDYRQFLPHRKFRDSSGWCGTGQDEFYPFYDLKNPPKHE
jgi:hypothetical protein